jgi:hypothetical protein
MGAKEKFKVIAMSRKRKQDSRVAAIQADIRTIEAVPRVSSFVPKPCACCEAIRPADTNYSRVKSTQGRIRYCKCEFCGNTWKEQGDFTGRVNQ